MRFVPVVVFMLMLWRPPVSATDLPVTPFKLGPQGGILVPMVVNGSGPHTFLVDTGASHSSISEELAKTVNARPVARTLVSTPAGDRECAVVQIDRIGVGPIAVAATATMVSSGDLKLAGSVAGVLGQDVLAGLTYTIDYRRRHIRWDTRDDLAGGAALAALPMAFHDGLPIVEVRHGDSVLRLVADSGAGGLVIFDGEGSALPGMTPDGGVVRVDSFHGSSMARSVRFDRFRVGDSTFRDLPAVLVRRTAAAAHRGDGLLPLHLFDRVTFDGPAGRLIVG